MTTLDDTAAAIQPQLVIFDLDGTLTDSAQGIVASFRHALREIGAEIPDGDLAGRIVGPPMHHTLQEMGLGDRATTAIAAYRADYIDPRLGDEQPVRRRFRNCCPISARPGSGWRWPPPRPSRRREGSSSTSGSTSTSR